MRSSKIWDFIGTNVISLATILLGVIVIALDQLGLIPNSIVSSAILALLALLATSEIVERKSKLSQMEESLESISKQLVDAVHGVKVRTFLNYDEAIDYLAKRTREARYSIDQASIDRKRMTRLTPATERFSQARTEVILSDRTKYRYLAVLYARRRLDQSREWVSNQTLHNLFTGFYPEPSLEIPLLSFTVIDKEEVFTRYPFELGQDSGYIAIRNSQVANLFLGYFERLWDDAQKIENEEDYDRLASALAR
jgi:hypothetical protein